MVRKSDKNDGKYTDYLEDNFERLFGQIIWTDYSWTDYLDKLFGQTIWTDSMNRHLDRQPERNVNKQKTKKTDRQT